MSRRVFGLLAAIGLAFAPRAAPAVVIDCDALGDATDRAICRDPALNPLDRLLADLIAATDDSDAVRREWQAARATCSDRDCLVALYGERIAALQSAALQRTTPASDGADVDDGEPVKTFDAVPEPFAATGPDDVPIQASGAAMTAPHDTDTPFDADMPVDTLPDASVAPVAGGAPAGVRVDTSAKHAQWTMAPALLLGLLATAVVFVVVIVLSALGHVVFYFDGRDFAWSLSPALAVAASMAGVAALQDPAARAARIAVITLGTGAAIVGAWNACRNAIRYNRSVPVGLLIGAYKMLLAAFMTFSLFANLARRSGEDYHQNTTTGRRERAAARTSFFVLGLLCLALFNGERVYAKKGWSLPAG